VTANSVDGGNFNRYWYANDNPYRFTDPDGRFGLSPFSPNGYLRQLGNGAKVASRNVGAALEQVDVRFKAGVAFGGGVELDVSIIRGDGKISVVPVGEGAFVGVMVQPREGYTASLENATESPITFSGGPSVKVGAVLAGGAEATLDPGGSVEVTPEGGVGIGAMAKYSPTVSLLSWGDKKAPLPETTKSPPDNTEKK
jgi:hypothetical protein